MTTPIHEDDVLIVGTGFSGIGMGIQLKRMGVSFTILEQADRVGGTWRDNCYPGAACDVPSRLYSFSFEPNPRFSRAYAPQPEILAYLERCAEKYGVTPHVRFGATVVRADFDAGRGTWDVTTRDGRTFRARVLVLGCGGLSRPSLPEIPGVASFEGKAFHSARWDDAYPFEGKTVALIGTGASAIQIVPELASKVAQLYVFQRTAPWILPKPDRAIGAAEQALYERVPAAQKLARAAVYARMELTATGFVLEPRILALAERLARKHLDKSVARPELRAQLTPSFRMGCKRILISNDYYPALQRENAALVTEPIRAITPRGVATADGVERVVDAIVYATGFQASEQVAPFEIRGAGGRDLGETWRDGAEAYLGTTVSGFPNLFFLVGPNTGLGHSSMVYMIESQIAYVASAIETMRARRWKSVDVLPAVEARYNERLRERLAHTVWATGCASWYQTRTGKNTTLWPGFTFEFRRRTKRFDPSDFACAPLDAPKGLFGKAARGLLRRIGALPHDAVLVDPS